MTQIAQALTIAGSDSGGGAGIQADLKTFQMRGVYGMSVLAAVTAQNTLGVQAIHGVPLDIIRAQIDSIATDFQVAAFKIGMLGTAEVIECVAEKISGKPFGWLVLDPVMVATSGARLLKEDAIAALTAELFPLAAVITPNLPELALLSGGAIQSREDRISAAQQLSKTWGCAVLAKGGHGADLDTCDDILIAGEKVTVFSGPRLDTPNTHGTGCTLSSAIAANLAKGFTLTDAIARAKEYVTGALAAGLTMGHGCGPLHHGFNLQSPFLATPEDRADFKNASTDQQRPQ